ncbi:DCC1-like thiol-disulfide oxidoreductase family protein [Salinithrix halophila]|uniref:DCC1-like thiol-disulfide oxidoreductase family protein n=1 Tax=Salinithrix halophila TaxID=1485204 RepID=A0ABV8JK65_9BACL
MNRVERFLTREHMLFGTSLLRISMGLGILYFFFYHYSERHLLWGAGGLWPTDAFLAGAEERHILTLFHLSESPWFFEGVYHIGILAALLFTLGYRTRWTTFLTFLVLWSFYYRNPFVTNGGENILRLQLFYLLFANAGAYLSLDARRQARRRTAKEPGLRPFSSALHNFAVAAIILQLLIMYFTSGIYKVMGSMWQNGTAVYYAMRVQDYVWPGLSEKVWSSEPLVIFLTYSSVLFQIAFPFLLLNRYTKYAAIGGAFLFHIGVGLMMNLALFSWYMISCEWILLSDRDYRFLGDWFRKIRAKGGNRMGNMLARLTERPFFNRHRITVYYDGWCPFCTQSVTTARRLDWFDMIRFVSFREPGVTEQYGLDPERLKKRLHSTNDGRHFREGIDGIIQMVQRLPLMWPILPVLLLSRWLGLGQRVYDWIASRRTIIPAGGCDDHCSIKDSPRSS